MRDTFPGLHIAALTSHDAHGFIPLDGDQATWESIRTKTDLLITVREVS